MQDIPTTLGLRFAKGNLSRRHRDDEGRPVPHAEVLNKLQLCERLDEIIHHTPPAYRFVLEDTSVRKFWLFFNEQKDQWFFVKHVIEKNVFIRSMTYRSKDSALEKYNNRLKVGVPDRRKIIWKDSFFLPLIEYEVPDGNGEVRLRTQTDHSAPK